MSVQSRNIMTSHPQKNLIESIENGKIDTVKALIISHPALIHARTESSIPIVLYAAYLKKWDVVDELIALGAELNVFEASAVGDQERLEQLLEHSPGLLNGYSTDGYTPLGLACYFGHVDIVQFLLDQGANTNKRSNNAQRVFPLHSALTQNDKDLALKLVTILLDYDAEADVAQQDGITALHQAAARGNLGVLKLLIRHGAKPQKPTDDGVLPIELAEERGHDHIVNYLNSL
ncbi:MAG: ankyrin repeat domain-containing protein [Bacteroidota bacterium]